jgi:hypothetical protein
MKVTYSWESFKQIASIVPQLMMGFTGRFYDPPAHPEQMTV